MLDEWGTWWDVEPGTNPGFLYQQNTLRDALVASVHFDVFHAAAERLVMANIAQTVNVLQAMILTDPDSGALVLTPTYHVFAMNTGPPGRRARSTCTCATCPPAQVEGCRAAAAVRVGLRQGRHRAGLAVQPRHRRPTAPWCSTCAAATSSGTPPGC